MSLKKKIFFSFISYVAIYLIFYYLRMRKKQKIHMRQMCIRYQSYHFIICHEKEKNIIHKEHNSIKHSKLKINLSINANNL